MARVNQIDQWGAERYQAGFEAGKREMEQRIKMLEEAIKLHRSEIWGDGAVGHSTDSALYAALAAEGRG